MLRSVAAFIIGFFIITATGAISFQLIRGPMMQASGWQPGMVMPSSYVWSTLAFDLGASILAGLLIAWIAGRHAQRVAVVLIIFLAAMRANQYVQALASHPHWYSFVLIFVPMVGLPAGLMLRKALFSRVLIKADKVEPRKEAAEEAK